MAHLPPDCTLLPLARDALLVSPGHAVFCRIPAEELPGVRRALRGEAPVDGLGDDLKRALERHGFFAAPGRSEPVRPTVQLQLTNACNLNCRYCCTNSRSPRARELDEAGFARILRDVRAHVGPGATVSFLGGEPFLVPFATRLARLALELGLRLTVFSNGLPLGEDDALLDEVAALTQEGVRLRISLAGATREACDRLSDARRYDAVLAVLGRLAARGGRARVDLMLMPQNAEDTAQELAGLRRRLPKGFALSLGHLYLSGREKGEHVFRSRRELERALTDIAFEAGEAIEAAPLEPRMPRRDGCRCAVGLNLNVRSDGSLFPCFKMEELVGHIEELSVGEALRRLRDDPHPASDLATCRSCALRTLCGGGCRSDNFLYTGTGEPLCGPWRVRVLSELLAEDCVGAVRWSVPHLHAEAKRRGIDVPDALPEIGPSRHCVDV